MLDRPYSKTQLPLELDKTNLPGKVSQQFPFGRIKILGP